MKVSFRFVKWTLWALAWIVVSVPVFAQTRGTLSGTIQDPSGAIVPGVSVTIRNTQTGEEFTAVSDSVGVYKFPSIPLGTYNLTAQPAGFKKYEMQGIVIQVAEPATANVKLQVGGANEQIVVTTEGQQTINTSTATLTNVISTRMVQDLPLPTRNPVDLARLQIGIAVTGDNTRTASVGGLRGSATNVTQDGVNAMDNFVKTDSFFALSAPSLASTQEFSVTVGTVGSDMGRGVAQVRMVTKSGTNELHGSVFYQHRNDFLEANSFFNNATYPVTPKPRERQHWFGVAAGGPVYVPKVYDGRTRSFWFFSYEGFRENFMATRNRTVMTDQARKGIFRYAGSDNQTQSVDLLSIGNVHTLNPITTAMLNAMPPSNNTLVGDGLNTAGWQYNVTGRDPSDKYVGRFDQELAHSQRFGYHTLEFVYNLADFLLTPDTFNAIEAPFPGGINAYQGSTRTLMAAAINSTFGNHMTNEARFGHQRAPVGFLREAPPNKPFFTGFASVTNFDNTFMAQGRNTLVYQFLDNYAYVRGTHTIRTGMDFQSISALTYNDAGIEPTDNMGTNAVNPDGILNAAFPNLPAGSSGTAIVNRARNVYADLTGNLATASQTFNVASPTSGFVAGTTRARNFKQRMLALYLQDEWRVKSNLTVNYGLRWEWQGVPYETQGLAIQPTTGIAGLYGISGPGNLFKPGSLTGTAPTYLDFVNGKTGKNLYNNDWNNLAPYVGIAYQPKFQSGPFKWFFGNGLSSIRVGYSISYLQDGFTVVSNALGTGTTNPGLIQSSANNTPTGVLTSAGVPITVPTFKMPISDADNLLVNTSNGLWVFDPNLRVPYVQQWSFGIEREIALGWVVEARYVGNHAIRVFRAYNINEVNIFENGFLTEFLNAQKNLALNGGSSFNPNCPGCVATPTLSTLFAGLANSSGFGSTTFISNLNNNNVGVMASTLAFQAPYKANRANLAPNFFVANPNANFARLLANASFSNYNSLQMEVRKRMRHGLYLQAGYTFSKSLTDEDQGSQSTLQDYITLRNTSLDKHRSGQDQSHRFIANFIYELPFGTGHRFMSGGFKPLVKVIEGWQVGGILNWQSGQPVSIFSGRSTFNSVTGSLPAQLVGMTYQQLKDAIGLHKTPVGVFFIDPQYLNITTNPKTGALTGAALKDGLMGPPAPGTLGNLPRYAFNGPQYSQVDFSLTKRMIFTERANVELKVNFLNAFNHPNFSFSNTNFDNANFTRISSTRGSPRIINFILSVNF